MTDQLRHVCFIAPGLGLGGAELHLAQYANGLASRGYRVSIIVIGKSDACRDRLDPGVEVVFLRSRVSSPKAWLRSLFEISQRKPHTVVGWALWGNVMASALKPLTRCSTTIVELNYLPEQLKTVGSFKRALMFGALRCLYPLADRVCANSNEVLNWLHAICGPNREYIRVFNPIDFARVDALSTERCDSADLDAWAGVRLLAVGRLVNSHKGFDHLVRACQLLDRDLKWTLLIVGDGEDRAQLEGQIDAAGLSDRIILLGSRRNPFAYYREADVFVLPSKFEGFPNVLLEAMGIGAATVATDCLSGPRELTEDGQVGILVAVDDASALSRALTRLITNSEARQRLGEAARKSVRSRYSEDRVFAALEKAVA